MTQPLTSAVERVPTAMFREAAEAPVVAQAQRLRTAATLRSLSQRLRSRPPRAVVTIARGSSDNAATYLRYLVETRLEILSASASPSVSAVFAASPAMAETLCVVISQSGRSPDLLAAAAAAARAGALVVAVVNDETSPLAEIAEIVVPLCAGAEHSVAATKTFIASLCAAAALVGEWAGDRRLLDAVDTLPDMLRDAWALDWSAAIPLLAGANHIYVVGRGPGLGVAQEIALKFKETCGLHAEAFSAAEVRHGPMTLAGPGFPVFALLTDDESRASVEAAVVQFAAQGAPVLVVGGTGGLPVVHCHPVLTPILQIQSFYRLVDAVAARRGFDPDRPAHLAKVTQTR